MQGDSALGRALALVRVLRQRWAWKKGKPPLLMAYRLQERAAGVGFDWPDAKGPIEKVKEEIEEVEREARRGKREAIEDEIGDLLFAVVNLARKLAIDPG